MIKSSKTQFLEKQSISVNTVLSYRTRIADFSLGGLIAYANKNTDALNLNVNGNIIFSFAIDCKQSDKAIISVELLIPVDNVFESNNHYVFKPRFHLENAVKIRHYGKFEDLIFTKNKLMQYIIESNLEPITDVYYSVVKYNTDNLADNIIDAYVGINGNIL